MSELKDAYSDTRNLVIGFYGSGSRFKLVGKILLTPFFLLFIVAVLFIGGFLMLVFKNEKE